MANQIFLFYGEEDFLIQQRIDELKKNIPDPSLNVETIDGEEPELEKIICALQTQSMLCGDRLVVIRNADLKLEIWDEVASGLKMISPGTRVVFWVSAFDKKSRLYKLVDQVGEVCEFKPFAEWEEDRLVFWIRKRVASLDREISPEAARELQGICGNNLCKLSCEIDKLITYIGERRSIEREDILALASPGEINVFALSNALADKDLKSSLKALHQLYKNRVDPLFMLSLLAHQYRVMLFSKSEKDLQKIAQALGVSPYFVKKCLDKGARFMEEELKNNLEILLETDLKLKSGSSSLASLELLLASLCGK